MLAINGRNELENPFEQWGVLERVSEPLMQGNCVNGSLEGEKNERRGVEEGGGHGDLAACSQRVTGVLDCRQALNANPQCHARTLTPFKVRMTLSNPRFHLTLSETPYSFRDFLTSGSQQQQPQSPRPN